jgi:murein DD-endopeptidase MepM/ murein hydrolase activator NlpD
MHARRWTVVIVGEDTVAPRTLRVSRRMMVGSGWLAGLVLTAVIALSIAGGIVYGRRGAPAGHAGAIPTDPALAAALLRDSIASLDRQTTMLRVVAGLDTAGAPAPESGGSVELMIHHADELSVNLNQVASKLHADADRVARTPSIMPTAGWLTSQFSLSRFHPILHKWLPHLGIDVAAPYGTTVVAPAAGTVIRVGTASGYGLVLEINHGNGIVTKYGHLSRFLVHIGQSVVRGQPVAEVGNSGLATGPHLHYEVHVNGTIVDPLTYVLPSTIPDPVHQDSRVPGAPEE